MRNLVLGLAISLDGFIEGSNGEIDWCFTDQDYGMTGFLKSIDSLFMGRKTYERSIAMGGENMGIFKMKEYVFSNTLKKLAEGKILIRGNIEDEVRKIKKESGKDIWLFGGAGLTDSLIKLQLVDELWLSIHPILLGSGKPLFCSINKRIHLELRDSKTFTTGLISVRYDIKY